MLFNKNLNIKTKIKICGIHSIKEAQKVSKYGADYLGILVEIPQTNLSLTIKKAKKIVKALPNIKFIVLTISSDLNDISKILREIRPWGIQLLKPNPILIKKIKKKYSHICVIPVVHITDFGSIKEAKKYNLADTLLLDSKKGYFLGGTGKIHNWKISKQIIKSSSIPIIVAGGLNIDNVQEAISFLHPYGIDVESALRNKKGYRDLIKVKKFINKIKSL